MRQRKKRIQGQSAPNKRPLEGEWSPLSDVAKKSGVIPYILVRGEGKMATGQPEAASVCKAKGWWRLGEGMMGPRASQRKRGRWVAYAPVRCIGLKTPSGVMRACMAWLLCCTVHFVLCNGSMAHTQKPAFWGLHWANPVRREVCR